MRRERRRWWFGEANRDEEVVKVGYRHIVGAQSRRQFGQPIFRRGGWSWRAGRNRHRTRSIARDQRLLDARRDDGDTNNAIQILVKGGADNNVGVLIDLLADPRGGFIDLEQRQVLAAGD